MTEGADVEPGAGGDVDHARAAAGVPDWEDPYLDRVADRLFANYDLERDYRARGERFDLYGRMEVHSQRHFLHPSLSFGHHVHYDHVFARHERPTVERLESLAELGHDIADEWIDPSEEHYGTEFSFVLVADTIPEDVRAFVDDFRDRTLLKYGYNGRYEIHLAVVAPAAETLASSRTATIGEAFRFWDAGDGRFSRLLDRLR